MASTTVHSYRELIIWQRAIQVCVAIYQATKTFPREEIYGLTNQMRRASVSVPSNIADGYGRLSRDQFRYFLGVAKGSTFELQTQLVIARELGFTSTQEGARIEALSFEVGKMLTAMLKKL
ncbi:MAG: four helix bundle protein [Acidobacteriaceae bacterium]